MSPLATATAAGALVGVAVWLIATGWSPAKTPLDVALAQLGQSPVELEPASGEVLDVRVGRWARKISLANRCPLRSKPL